MTIYNAFSVIGILLLIATAWLLSNNRKQVNWRTVSVGLLLQLIFAALVFWFPPGRYFFLGLNDVVVKILSTANEGCRFIFGTLAAAPGEPGSLGFFLIFQALPSIIFFSALMEFLYYADVIQPIVRFFARIFSKGMKISGAESLCAAANIFSGVESITSIRPFLEKLTSSELCVVLVTGLATVAANMIGFYVFILKDHIPNVAGHLITASILTAPAAVVMAKILFPETETPATMTEDITIEYDKPQSGIEAILRGSTIGGKLVFGIVTVVIAMLGIVALINLGLDGFSLIFQHLTHLSISLRIEHILGVVFYPFTLMLGMPPHDAWLVAQLLGERLMLTEVIAYQHLAGLMDAGALVSSRSGILATYALCGFAHVGSLAIFVGGTAALAPSQSGKLSQIAIRSLLAATLATLLSAAVVGIFLTV